MFKKLQERRSLTLVGLVRAAKPNPTCDIILPPEPHRGLETSNQAYIHNPHTKSFQMVYRMASES